MGFVKTLPNVIIPQSVYGSFFEYSDLKQNQKNQITEQFFGFSDLVLKRKKGKRNKQINCIFLFFKSKREYWIIQLLVLFVWYLDKTTMNAGKRARGFKKIHIKTFQTFHWVSHSTMASFIVFLGSRRVDNMTVEKIAMIFQVAVY